MTKLARSLVPALLALLVAAAPALAEPNRKTTLGPGAGQFAWDSSGTGIAATSTIYDEIGCTPINDCDDTLVELKSDGTLLVKTSSSDPVIDTDLTVWESDEQGTAKKQIINAAGTDVTSNEETTQQLTAGFYLVRIFYAVAVAGSVKGEATFTPDAAAPPAAGDGATPPAANNPPATKLSTKAKVKAKSLKSISGTATDDGKVAKVEVGVLQLGSSGSCKAMTSAGSFKSQAGCGEPKSFLRAKGTARWSLKLRKKLKKGRYVVFVRATDDKGAATTARGGFSAS
jgi:hypothetical protein